MQRRCAAFAALFLTLLQGVFAPARAGENASPERATSTGISVGAISDLDLDALRRVIDRHDEVAVRPTPMRRTLSLEEALKVALENNLALQVSALDVKSSDLAIDQARSKFHPSVGFEADMVETRRAHSDRVRPDEFTEVQDARLIVRQEVPTGGAVSLGLGYGREFKDEYVEPSDGPGFMSKSVSEIAGLGIEIHQPLLRGGRIYVARRQILDAQYDDEISRAELRSQILRVTAQTKAAYYRVIQTLRQIEVVEAALLRDEELVEASTALFDAGRVSRVDVYSAEINRSKDEARLADAHADLELAQNELRKVIGLGIDIQIDVSDRTIPFKPPRVDLQGWLERAFVDRPEMVRARSEVEKSELAVRVAGNSKLPSLDLRGGFQPGFDWKSWNWNAGIGIEYPIGNVAGKSRFERARIAEARSRRAYLHQKREVDLEVREVEIRLREGIERLKSLTLQVENSRSKREIARGRFEMGLANNLDIREADEELIRSESLLLAALVDYASNQAQLEARIGGPL
jgi:outer membrane protein TolC